MKRKLLFVNSVRFTEEHLIINTNTINYCDIDLIRLQIPNKGSNPSKVYSSTHFLTIFIITNRPISVSMNLSNKESKELIEEIQQHIKDHIIEYYDSEIFVSD